MAFLGSLTQMSRIAANVFWTGMVIVIPGLSYFFPWISSKFLGHVKAHFVFDFIGMVDLKAGV